VEAPRLAERGLGEVEVASRERRRPLAAPRHRDRLLRAPKARELAEQASRPGDRRGVRVREEIPIPEREVDVERLVGVIRRRIGGEATLWDLARGEGMARRGGRERRRVQAARHEAGFA